MKKTLIIAFAGFVLASCGTHKNIVSDNGNDISTTITSAQKKQLDFVRKVSDNAVYTQNIVSKISFSIDAFGKDIAVDGKLSMRKNEVIRIVLMPLGLMEVGRLEFTPDYVLLVNRIDKEYVKAKYSDVDFMKNNGLNFYTLQSLFWNELFVPGKQTLSDTMLKNFDVDFVSKQQNKVSLETDNLIFTWDVNPSTTKIDNANVEYGHDTSFASNVSWKYSDFTAVGNKQFPSNQTISVSSRALRSGEKMSVGIKMKKVTTDSDWESLSTISDRYRQVSVDDILRKLTSF